MTTMHHPDDSSPLDGGRRDLSDAVVENAVASQAPTTEGWTPEDREPSAAENNFMSFALFGFLILFAIGCLIFF